MSEITKMLNIPMLEISEEMYDDMNKYVKMYLFIEGD